MRWSARKLVLVGLGVGVAAYSAATLWLYEQPHTSARVVHPAAGPTKQGRPSNIEALAAEVTRWKGKLKSDLTALRSQLARVDRDQDATDQQLNQLADKMSRADFEGATGAARDEGAEAVPLTPEQEHERAAARDQAELTLMEGTLHAEKHDPAWGSTAQHALHETFQKQAIPGVQMVDAECRSTLCRMELALDDSTAQDSYRNLLNLAPWSGPSLIQIDTETGAAVMYLAREEHTLPQLPE
jgi:hypothetical protein